MLEKKYSELISYFEENMPVAESELNYENPYQLIVAVILSAQCTDKRVNMTTPALFERFPDAQSLSEATVEEVYSLIKSISYPNNKAKKDIFNVTTKYFNRIGIKPITNPKSNVCITLTY